MVIYMNRLVKTAQKIIPGLDILAIIKRTAWIVARFVMAALVIAWMALMFIRPFVSKHVVEGSAW
jgi:hypothetical protein